MAVAEVLIFELQNKLLAAQVELSTGKGRAKEAVQDLKIALTITIRKKNEVQ